MTWESECAQIKGRELTRKRIQIGSANERDGDGSHGRVQTCDAVIKRGGTAAPASLLHICELATIAACGVCTQMSAIYRQHIRTHAVGASR